MSNTRTTVLRGFTINSVGAAAALTASIQAGYDEKVYSEPDGLALPIRDRASQFVRGTVSMQDWTKAIAILTGTLGTLEFYVGESGADTFQLHVLANPIIHRLRLDLRQGQYGSAQFDFECRFDDAATTIKDVWTVDAAVAAPDYVAAAFGGWRFVSAALGLATIQHITALDFTLTVPIFKASNDSDLGYTAVDRILSGLRAAGSLACQDSEVAESEALKLADLTDAARGSLVVTARMHGAAADKVLTFAGCEIDAVRSNPTTRPYTEHSIDFELTNDQTTQLTLAGDNKILTIANAA